MKIKINWHIITEITIYVAPRLFSFQNYQFCILPIKIDRTIVVTTRMDRVAKTLGEKRQEQILNDSDVVPPVSTMS